MLMTSAFRHGNAKSLTGPSSRRSDCDRVRHQQHQDAGTVLDVRQGRQNRLESLVQHPYRRLKLAEKDKTQYCERDIAMNGPRSSAMPTRPMFIFARQAHTKSTAMRRSDSWRRPAVPLDPGGRCDVMIVDVPFGRDRRTAAAKDCHQSSLIPFIGDNPDELSFGGHSPVM
jgi:hypothetical protein